MGVKVLLKNVRLAFANLFEPYMNNDGKGSYGCKLIVVPDHPQVTEIVKAMQAAATEEWGEKAAAIYKTLKANNKLCLHDGEEKADYAGFSGNLFVSANNKEKPLLIDGNKNELSAASGKLYPGCYVNASIEIWAQNSKDYGKRINAGLRGVQFAADGERLAGGGTASEDEFEAIPQAEGATEGAAAAFGEDEDPFG